MLVPLLILLPFFYNIEVGSDIATIATFFMLQFFRQTLLEMHIHALIRSTSMRIAK
jgi:hypothetical protein